MGSPPIPRFPPSRLPVKSCFVDRRSLEGTVDLVSARGGEHELAVYVQIAPVAEGTSVAPRQHMDRRQPETFLPHVAMRPPPRGRTPLLSLHDHIHIALVRGCSQGARVFYRQDLLELGVDAGSAYLAARDRLGRLVNAGVVQARTMQGPLGLRCVVYRHTFLAASCVVLPDLYARSADEICSERLCVAIPRRDLMVVLPDLGPDFRREFGERVGAPSMFVLEPSGLGPRLKMTNPEPTRYWGDFSIDVDVDIDVDMSLVDRRDEVTRSGIIGEAPIERMAAK